MASAQMPDEFMEELEAHLPPEQPVGPKGGRPPIAHAAVMRVIWFVLCSGCRWEDVPAEMDCSGRTAHRRLRQWEELGIWDRLHMHLLKLLRKRGELDPHMAIVDSVIVRAIGRRRRHRPKPRRPQKTGHQTHVARRPHGIPMAIRTAAANASDHTQILPIVLDFPAVGGKPGRPKQLPDEVFADRGYDSDDTRHCCAWLGIEPLIARRKTAHGSGLGKVRWVVERTISWLKGLRRMRVRYDR